MNITKQKWIFIGMVSTVLISMAGYAYWQFGNDSSSVKDMQAVEVPELKEAPTTYTNKKEAVDALEPERNFTPPSVYDVEAGDTLQASMEKKLELVADGDAKVSVANNSATIGERPKVSWVAEAKEVKRSNKTDAKEAQQLLKSLAQQQQQLFADVELESDAALLSDTDAILFAKVRGTQTVQNKYRLEMELMEQAEIRGQVFDAHTRLYGFVAFQPNRTLLHITNVGGMEVSLKAFDKQDGNEGIYTVNSFRAEATKEAVTQTIGEISIPAFPVQTSFVQQLLKGNNRKVRVTVTDGYELLLKPKL